MSLHKKVSEVLRILNDAKTEINNAQDILSECERELDKRVREIVGLFAKDCHKKDNGSWP